MKKVSISFLLFLLILNNVMANKTHVIKQKNKKFDQQEITVNIGDTIIFKNEEINITHNVYSNTPGNEFEIRVQRPGKSTPIPLSKKKHQVGELTVKCAIHPKMKLKVKIVPQKKVSKIKKKN